MRACIIIPARYGSTRFPGKPLAPLRGASGVAHSLLARTYAAASAAAAAAGGIPVFVATDDQRIAKEAERIGAPVVMTAKSCRNGTERVAEAVLKLGLSVDAVVNFQGDAPLTPPHFVPALLARLAADPTVAVATPVLRCSPEAVQHLLADRRAGRVGATTAVFDRKARALYFSKEVLPFSGASAPEHVVVFHHVGLYAYRTEALAAYVAWEPGRLEEAEGLEQLRFLENGWPVACVLVEAPGAKFWELNNPSDTALIEAYLTELGIE